MWHRKEREKKNSHLQMSIELSKCSRISVTLMEFSVRISFGLSDWAMYQMICPQNLTKCQMFMEILMEKNGSRLCRLVFWIHNTWSKKKKFHRVHSQSFENRDLKLMIYTKWYAQSEKMHSVFIFGWVSPFVLFIKRFVREKKNNTHLVTLIEWQ